MECAWRKFHRWITLHHDQLLAIQDCGFGALRLFFGCSTKAHAMSDFEIDARRSLMQFASMKSIVINLAT